MYSTCKGSDGSGHTKRCFEYAWLKPHLFRFLLHHLVLQVPSGTFRFLLPVLGSAQHTTMAYHKKYKGKCHCCRTCRPKSWYMCNLCQCWMGASCNWGREGRMWLSRKRIPPVPYVSWHCLIETQHIAWNSEERQGRYAVMCEPCAREKLWEKSAFRGLPHHCIVLVFQFVSHSTMW